MYSYGNLNVKMKKPNENLNLGDKLFTTGVKTVFLLNIASMVVESEVKAKIEEAKGRYKKFKKSIAK